MPCLELNSRGWFIPKQLRLLSTCWKPMDSSYFSKWKILFDCYYFTFTWNLKNTYARIKITNYPLILSLTIQCLLDTPRFLWPATKVSHNTVSAVAIARWSSCEGTLHLLHCTVAPGGAYFCYAGLCFVLSDFFLFFSIIGLAIFKDQIQHSEARFLFLRIFYFYYFMFFCRPWFLLGAVLPCSRGFRSPGSWSEECGCVVICGVSFWRSYEYQHLILLVTVKVLFVSLNETCFVITLLEKFQKSSTISEIFHFLVERKHIFLVLSNCSLHVSLFDSVFSRPMFVTVVVPCFLFIENTDKNTQLKLRHKFEIKRNSNRYKIWRHKKQKKFNHKMTASAKWQKYRYDFLAFSRWFVSVIIILSYYPWKYNWSFPCVFSNSLEISHFGIDYMPQ